VYPVVDEPGVPLVDVLIAPHHLQQRGQCHLAAGMLDTAIRERGEHRRGAAQPANADLGHQLRLVQRDAGHVVILGRVGQRVIAQHPGDDVGDQALARAAAATRPGRGHHPGDGALPLPHAGHQRCLAHPVAVAHLGLIGQLRRAHLRGGHTDIKQQLDPLLGQRYPPVESVCQLGDLADIAEQGGTDQDTVTEPSSA
jgi:hypothetical protein